ncbi:D-aminoacyl-tRNA deacylase [Chromobacterium violaceum]|uniref:D-aminoacyl-tRNA deacylase n=1 Tax=Chromobacterium violaceum TaxID=536 RepID=A0AAX2M5H4_CHRVL|nr:D-aminoacyl-tRNA deacylase [Chromobacterium violaceum]MBX9267716.1 D-tyrosyl-tRNA(Tyr) deacylase [Chromobacterium violaceum]OLZ75070.1 D-tyrosyl-tRNA(Tyr) deacylase [Chromobacterium violaceum]STB71585.1 D-tyrosyl-tRNA(Tyr) deacylase [Chromobacterium violaceum]SUX31433.1 D-tyrosyl-tRNA(Tyr) deacylase [Chromobacterium violaceum]
MRVLVQRVSQAAVTVDGQISGEIGAGALLLVGIEEADGPDDIGWLVRKISQLRIFNDEAGVMNRSLIDCGGEALAVSQFTLHASVKKGNRPSYSRAARGEISRPLFDRFVAELSAALGKTVPTGVFGADMRVSLVNDGPVTIWLDSRNPE